MPALPTGSFADGADLVFDTSSNPDAVGETVRVLLQARGPGPISYQWLFNYEDIPGANGPTLEIDSPQLFDEGTYSVVIDGFLNGIAMGLVPFFTRLAGRAQSGYIFTYAFWMVIGIVFLISWMTLSGGGE